MEELAEIQKRRIKELENYNRAMTIPVTKIAAASTITENSSRSSSNKLNLQFFEMKTAMQKMCETVSSQETLVADLIKRI